MGLSHNRVCDGPAINGITPSKESDADLCNFLKINRRAQIGRGRLMAGGRRRSPCVTGKAQLCP